MVMRSTHTYAELAISQEAYDEIAGKLRAAGYDHAFMDEGAIDMHGIGIIVEEPDRFEALFGSDVLPSIVKLSDTVSVQLGEVVRTGFDLSGLTVRQWNKLPTTFREVLLGEALVIMKREVANVR